MMRTAIKPILDYLTATQGIDFGITINNEIVYTHSDVINEMRRYNDYLFYYWDEEKEPKLNFINEWLHYRTLTNENFEREYKALYSEYNPIENYSLNESSLDGERIAKKTETTTPTGGTKTETTNKINGFDSVGDGVNADKVTTENTPLANTKTETTHTSENDKSGDYNGETKTGFDNVKEHYFNRSGNIGTMTASDMIEKEKKIRNGMKNAMLYNYVKEFIYFHCAFC